MGIPHIVAIVAGSPDGRRADLARQLGATDVCSLAQTGPEAITAHIQELSGGIGADVVVEASGSPAAVPMGLALLRNRGVYLAPGQYSNSGGIEIQPQMITFKALQIIGSSQYSVQDVRNYLLFLQAHPELHAGISALAGRYRVAEINRAFREAKDRACVKIMLTP